ncbi:MAG TPA: M50 family metallopeptidase [Chloroflexota bacterium]|jgi:Zn-dependent protease|nr:M50 family metallopeptidase [Chloroflexota bacterium]
MTNLWWRAACGRRAGSILWRIDLPTGKNGQFELRLHVLFVLTALCVTFLLARTLFPAMFPGWASASYWLVALAVTLIDGLAGLLHELGHAVVALARGRKVHHITLYGLVAAARRSAGSQIPRDQLVIAVAGPVSQMLMASVLMFAATALPSDNPPLRVAAGFPGLTNLLVGLLNLLPLSPLDGGRAARALVAVVVRV